MNERLSDWGNEQLLTHIAETRWYGLLTAIGQSRLGMKDCDVYDWTSTTDEDIRRTNYWYEVVSK